MKDYLGFLSIPAIYHTIHASITWPSNHPVGIGAQETGTNAETGFTTMNSKLSFVSQPGISCLLTASMYLW